MKKILLALAIVMTMGYCANAQGGMDGFFNSYNEDYRAAGDQFDAMNNTMPGHGQTTDAPLGGGLLILTALGVGYAASRKRK